MQEIFIVILLCGRIHNLSSGYSNLVYITVIYNISIVWKIMEISKILRLYVENYIESKFISSALYMFTSFLTMEKILIEISKTRQSWLQPLFVKLLNARQNDRMIVIRQICSIIFGDSLISLLLLIHYWIPVSTKHINLKWFNKWYLSPRSIIKMRKMFMYYLLSTIIRITCINNVDIFCRLIIF